MSFEWILNKPEEIKREDIKQVIDEEEVGHCSVYTTCINRGTDKIKICWDIMNEIIFADNKFTYNDEVYEDYQCSECKDFYLLKNFVSKFICPACIK